MNASDLKTQVLPCLLSGLARTPLPFDKIGGGDLGQPALQALSLTGQAMRFDRPCVPDHFAAQDTVIDGRAIVPDALRRLLIRLLGAKKTAASTADNLALEVARTLARTGQRLHPFDLPRLEGFVGTHTEHLGAEALAWCQRSAPQEIRHGYFEADQISDENWSLASPAQKARYIEGRRREDPAAARKLVEAVWSTESPDSRVRLLQAVQTGLSPEDQDFLHGLAKDRAPRVRDLAERLLARLPGASGLHQALNRALERIKTDRTGLTLELPATLQPPRVNAWVLETFAGIGCEELARALDLTTETMVAAAAKDRALRLALTVMASRDRRFDLLGEIVAKHLPDAWDQLLQGGFDDLGVMTRDEGLRWAEIVVTPQNIALHGLIRLHRLMGGPVSDGLMGRILGADLWIDGAALGAELANILAALCPLALRPALRAEMAGLDRTTTDTALLFLDIIDALEGSKPHDRDTDQT